MTWQDECNSWSSRIAASRNDDDLNDVVFDVDGEKEKANRTILSMASTVMKTAFYGSLAEKPEVLIPIKDGTARGFRAMLDFVYNEGTYSVEDLLDGKDEITECDNLKKVMELVYFGDKYLINSLLSFCRGILIHKLKITIETVMQLYGVIAEYKTILNTEYSIVNSSIKVFIDTNFDTIFKDAKVTTRNCVAENLMVELLQRQTIVTVTEGFVMQVALDYVRFYKELHEGLTWKEVAQRLVPKVIDFSKLSLKELDLTGSYNILPQDVLLKVLTKTTEANKNGLVGSVKRNTENVIGEIVNIDVHKVQVKSTRAQAKSQIKLKVNRKCLFQFNVQDQRVNLYGSSNSTPPWPYKSISWKPEGGIKEVAAKDGINKMKFLAEPGTEINVEFEMVQELYQYCLNYVEDGKFMDKAKKIKIEIVEVNGKPFQEAIAFDAGVHFRSLHFLPL